MRGDSQKEISGLIDYLVASGYLQASGGQYPVLQITAAGVAVLKGQAKVTRKMAVKVQKKRCLKIMNYLNNYVSYAAI